MKAVAKSNIKYNDTWYTKGDSFEVKAEDIEALGGMVDVDKPTKLADMNEKPTPKKDEKKKQEKAE